MKRAEYNPCVTCDKGCCHDYTVTVTGYDAWLIATLLQMAMEQFLIYFPTDKGEPDTFTLDRSGRRFNIALAKRDEGAAAKACVFWMSFPEGYGGCGIYALRPLVCQNYPAFLHEGIVHLRTDALCPARSWNLAAMDLPAWRERLLRYQMEYDIYCYVVERWNAHLAAAADPMYQINVYYGYLMALYDRLDQVRQAVSAADTKMILLQWGQATAERRNPLKHAGANTDHGANPTWMEVIAGLRQTIDTFLPHAHGQQSDPTSPEYRLDLSVTAAQTEHCAVPDAA